MWNGEQCRRGGCGADGPDALLTIGLPEGWTSGRADRRTGSEVARTRQSGRRADGRMGAEGTRTWQFGR